LPLMLHTLRSWAWCCSNAQQVLQLLLLLLG
jgi:hypothetical protein